MSPRHRAVAVLSVVAVLSLGLKATAIQGAPAPSDEASRLRLSRFLADRGFSPTEVPPMAGIGMVGGTRGECRLILAGMSLQGWQDDILGQVRSPGDTIRFVWGGREHAEPPRWQARFAYYGDKIRRGMGLPASGRNLTGAILSPGCAGDGIDWADLA